MWLQWESNGLGAWFEWTCTLWPSFQTWHGAAIPCGHCFPWFNCMHVCFLEPFEQLSSGAYWNVCTFELECNRRSICAARCYWFQSCILVFITWKHGWTQLVVGGFGGIANGDPRTGSGQLQNSEGKTFAWTNCVFNCWQFQDFHWSWSGGWMLLFGLLFMTVIQVRPKSSCMNWGAL